MKNIYKKSLIFMIELIVLLIYQTLCQYSEKLNSFYSDESVLNSNFILKDQLNSFLLHTNIGY